MEQINNFIKPELLVLIPVLYFIGMGIKNSEAIGNKHIPMLLGLIGMLLSCLYVCGTEGISALVMFTAITQGILCAGASVFTDQLLKQSKKVG